MEEDKDRKVKILVVDNLSISRSTLAGKLAQALLSVVEVHGNSPTGRQDSFDFTLEGGPGLESLKTAQYHEPPSTKPLPKYIGKSKPHNTFKSKNQIPVKKLGFRR